MNEDEFAREIHHQVKRKFKRRKVIVTGIDEIWYGYRIYGIICS